VGKRGVTKRRSGNKEEKQKGRQKEGGEANTLQIGISIPLSDGLRRNQNPHCGKILKKKRKKEHGEGIERGNKREKKGRICTPTVWS